MEDTLDIYPGVRAEPRFLRDPTSLEALSSGISRFSSFVTSNLSKRTPPFSSAYVSDAHKQPPAVCSADAAALDEHESPNTITYASFQKLELDAVASRLCLLLCYQDGFQVWDVANPDNVHEICSVKDMASFGTVVHLHAVKTPQPSHDSADPFAHERPLLAVISSSATHDDTLTAFGRTRSESNDASRFSQRTDPTPTKLSFYSLKTHAIVKEWHPFGEDETDTHISTIQSNARAVVVGCGSSMRSSLQVVSAFTLEPMAAPLTDVFHPSPQGPTFALGARFLAYATSAPVLNANPGMSSLTKGIGSKSLGVLQGDRDMAGTAKDIAKEVVSGVKTLGGFGYQKLSNYFSATHGKPYMTTNAARRASTGMDTGRQPDDRPVFPITPPSHSSTQKMAPCGMIMVRDLLKLPTAPSRNLSTSTVAHIKPHVHPISNLTFNSAGTLLLSASKLGHTFHIFSILPSSTQTGNAAHLYSLSRGYTDAHVVDCQFSDDSTWCAVTTARGTTHVYAINPYGNKPDILGHVRGKVNNPVAHPLATRGASQAQTLQHATRIKQRREMPVSTSHHDSPTSTVSTPAEYGASQGYFGPTTPMAYPCRLTARRQRKTCANLATAFVSTTQLPFLDSRGCYSPTKESHSGTAGQDMALANASLASLKQQATQRVGHVLSTLGSTSIGPYLPAQSVWATASDKTNDNRMFGFDEEEQTAWEDEAAKMISDEVGYQDLYSFHPSGTLTLHRCWATRSVARKREYNRTMEKVELAVKGEDMAEWHVARAAEWEEVKGPWMHGEAIETEPEAAPKKSWLSNAEITTYATHHEPTLWSHTQCVFQTYTQSQWEDAVCAEDGRLPETETVVVRHDLPEPYSSRIDRVGKTTTGASKGLAEENLDDALAELEENLSKAMQTSFSPVSPFDASPSEAKRMPNLTDRISGSSSQGRSPMDRLSSLSFEDAYLIRLSGGGVEPSRQTPKEYDFLIQLDDSTDDEVRLATSDEASDSIEGDDSDDFLPDGDNEVAFPNGSFLAEQVFEF